MPDVDFYAYTVPSTPVQGGCVVVSLTQFGPDGALDMTTQALADNGDVIDAHGSRTR